MAIEQFLFVSAPAHTERIWTIGHSVHTQQVFISLLQEHGIELLVDVRTFPASRRVPWFNKEPFAEALAGQGIGYVHLPGLGGRRTPRIGSPHMAWRNTGFRGYADHMDTHAFAAAQQQLKEIARAHRSALMCAEVLWWRCHRSLIADRLKVEGWEVLHIMPGKVQEHPYTKAAHVVDGQLTYAPSSLL
jgi:uncharacterized protein (DUF488 family)